MPASDMTAIVIGTPDRVPVGAGTSAGEEGPNSIISYRSDPQETPAVEPLTVLFGVASPVSVNSLDPSIPSPPKR